LNNAVAVKVRELKLANFLVTGASGFVGKWLIELLLERHFNVTAVIRETPQQEVLGCRTVRVPQISGVTDWSQLLSNIDVVVHLAARVHVMQETEADALSAFQAVNLHGTINLARQAAASGSKRFVYISSIKVNGEHTNISPFVETDTPAPQDPYAISKWQAEQALHEISKETGMEVVILRPPLVYGPGVKANFYNLMRLVSKALPLPIGLINNHRSMIYVENLVDAILACAIHPNAAGQTYLVSDGRAVSTPELVHQIASAMNKPCRVFSFPVSLLRLCAFVVGKSAMMDRLSQSLAIDDSKIRLDLNWRSPYTSKQGIEKTVNWFLENSDRQKTLK